MCDLKTYKATITRAGKWWMIAIADIDGHAQTRRLADAEAEAIDYIAASLGIPEEDIHVDVDDVYVDDFDVAAEVGLVADLGDRADEAAAKYSAAIRDLASRLHAAKVVDRDIGEMLGISYQRVQQIRTTPCDRTG